MIPTDLAAQFPLAAKRKPAWEAPFDIVEAAYQRPSPSQEAVAAQRTARLREREDERVKLVRRLLPVVDALDRLLEGHVTVEENPVLANYVRGMEALRKRLARVMEREGVEPLGKVGEPVDLDCHEVVDVVEDPPYEQATIVDVQQRGYRMGRKVLRDAKVIAARKPAGASHQPSKSTETTVRTGDGTTFVGESQR